MVFTKVQYFIAGNLLILIFIVYAYNVKGEVQRISNVGLVKASLEQKETLRVLRGSNYLSEGSEHHSEYLITQWEVSHFVYHAIVAYYFDYKVSIVIGVGFEILEHVTNSSGSFLDLIYNFAGLLFGTYLKNLQ